MTIVEFFDKNDIENIISSLVCEPDRVVFIGHKAKKMHKAIENYKQVLKRRGKNISLEIKSVNRNDLAKIVEALSEILHSDSDCHFDLEGGEELYLVAVGILAAKFGDKVGLHKYNVSSDMFIDCDEDGNPSHQTKTLLSASENVLIYSGRILKSLPAAKNEEDIRDLKKLWDILKINPSMYNSQINALSLAAKHYTDQNSLCLTINFKAAQTHLEKEGEKFVFIPNFFSSLLNAGLITDLENSEEAVSFKYKSSFVRRLLSKAGNCLEQYITYLADTCTDSRGEKIYNDVLTSVCIDWDDEDTGTPVENEIDVLLMHNMVPVFISCKNGFVDSDELYKLSQVAERFGGKYAKKVLIVSELDKIGASGDFIRARAEEMGIKLIDNAAFESEDGLRKTISGFWS